MRGALIALLVVIAGPALAACGTPETAERVVKEHGEIQLGEGISKNGVPLSIWVNPETGTYSVFVHRPDGIVCMVDAGDKFIIGEPPADT